MRRVDIPQITGAPEIDGEIRTRAAPSFRARNEVEGLREEFRLPRVIGASTHMEYTTGREKVAEGGGGGGSDPFRRGRDEIERKANCKPNQSSLCQSKDPEREEFQICNLLPYRSPSFRDCFAYITSNPDSGWFTGVVSNIEPV